MIDGKGEKPMPLDSADSEYLDFDRLLSQAFNQNKNETLAQISAMKKSKRPIKASQWEKFFGQNCYRNCREENEVILKMMELLEQRHYTQEAIDVILAEMNELLTMSSMSGLEFPEDTLMKLRASLQRLQEEKAARMVSERGYDGKEMMKLRSTSSGFVLPPFGPLLLSLFVLRPNIFFEMPELTAFIVVLTLFTVIFIFLRS